MKSKAPWMRAVNRTKLTEGGLPKREDLEYVNWLLRNPFKRAKIVMEAFAPDDDPVRENVAQAEIRGEPGPERAIEEVGDPTILHEYANYTARLKERSRRYSAFLN